MKKQTKVLLIFSTILGFLIVGFIISKSGGICGYNNNKFGFHFSKSCNLKDISIQYSFGNGHGGNCDGACPKFEMKGYSLLTLQVEKNPDVITKIFKNYSVNMFPLLSTSDTKNLTALDIDGSYKKFYDGSASFVLENAWYTYYFADKILIEKIEPEGHMLELSNEKIGAYLNQVLSNRKPELILGDKVVEAEVEPFLINKHGVSFYKFLKNKGYYDYQNVFGYCAAGVTYNVCFYPEITSEQGNELPVIPEDKIIELLQDFNFSN